MWQKIKIRTKCHESSGEGVKSRMKDRGMRWYFDWAFKYEYFYKWEDRDYFIWEDRDLGEYVSGDVKKQSMNNCLQVN